MNIKVGKYKVGLNEFIKAVVDNTDNEVIEFNCKDADYQANVKFQVAYKDNIQRVVKKGTA